MTYEVQHIFITIPAMYMFSLVKMFISLHFLLGLFLSFDHILFFHIYQISDTKRVSNNLFSYSFFSSLQNKV